MRIKNNISKKETFIHQAFPKKTKNDILYSLISIYYYEQTLSFNNNKELIFNENQTYYKIF